MKKFIFSPDKHVGWERKNGAMKPLHDIRAINAMLKFASDFKPDVWIEGGDNLDCGPVSHWLKDKKVSIQDMHLDKDIREYREKVLFPINQIMGSKGTKIWMEGNHEQWLRDLGEFNPGIANMFAVDHLLPLSDWTVLAPGAHYKLGKLYFVHGDNLRGVNVAASALNLYGHPMRFGHFHTFQVATKYSLIDSNDVKNAIAVPGLCQRNPNFMRQRPNQWLMGFNYGYIHDDGTFTDYVPLIIKGKFSAEGRTYRG